MSARVRPILVVDDNEIQRDLVRDLLTPLGFTVLTASSGRECLALAERDKPNLILLDIAMPEMDGWQVAQRLRQASRERDRHRHAVGQRHRSRAGCWTANALHDDYLMKPIDLRQLLKKIHALLNIEWIYEPGSATSGRRRRSLVRSALPPASDIDELISLGEIGHVRRILEKLREIEQQLAEYAATSSMQMRGIRERLRPASVTLAALEAIRSSTCVRRRQRYRACGRRLARDAAHADRCASRRPA